MNRDSDSDKIYELDESTSKLEVKTSLQLLDQLMYKCSIEVAIARGFNTKTRNNAVPVTFALNLLLWYTTKLNHEANLIHVVDPKAFIGVIDYVMWQTLPAEEKYRRCRYGNAHNGNVFYIHTVGGSDNSNKLLAVAVFYEHRSYAKYAQMIKKIVTIAQRSHYENLWKPGQLKQDSEVIRFQVGTWLKPEFAKNAIQNDESFDSSSETSSVDELSMWIDATTRSSLFELSETTKATLTRENENNNNNNNLHNASDSFDLNNSTIDRGLDDSEFSDYLPPALSNASTVSTSHEYTADDILDEDDELRDLLEEDEILQELVQPPLGASVAEYIPANDIKAIERKAMHKQLLLNMQKKTQIAVQKRNEEAMDKSFLRRQSRDSERFQILKRRGKVHFDDDNITMDSRVYGSGVPRLYPTPSKSWNNQDDDYLDYAFYGFVREDGTMVNDIMTLPLGKDYNSQRRGSNVYIRAIHFKNTFTHVTGSKATGRMILFYSKYENIDRSLFSTKYKSIAVHDILQKSTTMYAGDLEEAEAIDVFYNPTIMSFYDFKNVILGERYQVLYDYYADLNTQAVKGVVGEDVESVDSIKTKWVKLDGLDLPFFYDGNDKIATRGMLGVLFMGDYFGGEVETNLVLRVYFNSK